MKDNKLIAEFMGRLYKQEFLEKGVGGVFEEVVLYEDLQYHTSWDWLMPVVIKIGGTANILGAMHKLRPYSLVRNIDDTYQAVVEFIKQLKQE